MFLENNENGLVYMCSDVIPFRHIFTTRYGGVSAGHLKSLNLIGNHGDSPENIRENFRRVAALFGVGENDCAVTRQVHGNAVRIVTSDDRHVCLSEVPYEADGIVTAVPGLPIFCFTADCVPVLLCEKEAGVIGAVHCGWRSSVADILKNAVDAMCSLGAKPDLIRAAIGPAIGFCCFETDRDVPEAVEMYIGKKAAAPYIRKRDDGKYLVDLRGANACRLQQLGIPEQMIDISEECTFCSHEKYWSHRFTRGKRGGQAAAIALPIKGGRE